MSMPEPEIGDEFETVEGRWLVTGVPAAASVNHDDVVVGVARSWAWQTLRACRGASPVTRIWRGKKLLWSAS